DRSNPQGTPPPRVIAFSRNELESLFRETLDADNTRIEYPHVVFDPLVVATRPRWLPRSSVVVRTDHGRLHEHTAYLRDPFVRLEYRGILPLHVVVDRPDDLHVVLHVPDVFQTAFFRVPESAVHI